MYEIVHNGLFSHCLLQNCNDFKAQFTGFIFRRCVSFLGGKGGKGGGGGGGRVAWPLL